MPSSKDKPEDIVIDGVQSKSYATAAASVGAAHTIAVPFAQLIAVSTIVHVDPIADIQARFAKLTEQIAEYKHIMTMPGTHVVHMEKWVADIEFLLSELALSVSR